MTSKTQYERDMDIIEAATDGPWFHHDGLYATNSTRGVLSDGDCVAERVTRKNAVYISHFNPSYIRHLVTELEELRNACGDLLSLINRIAPNVDYEEVKKAKEVLK